MFNKLINMIKVNVNEKLMKNRVIVDFGLTEVYKKCSASSNKSRGSQYNYIFNDNNISLEVGLDGSEKGVR